MKRNLTAAHVRLALGTDGSSMQAMPATDAGPIRLVRSDVQRDGRSGGVYDMAKVGVTQRYADRSTWQTPCCDRLADCGDTLR